MSSKTISIAAVILLTKDQKSVLLQHRDSKPDISWPDYWAIPGGHMEESEDPLKAAIREFKEETGYVCFSLYYFTVRQEQYDEHTVYKVFYF